MRIVIVGSSLVYNRTSQYDSYEPIYGFLLKKYLRSKGTHDVFIFGRAKNHTRMQSRRDRLLYDIEQFEPDIVILHLGIVDCAPRLFLEQEQIYLQSLPNFIRIKLIKFLAKHRYYITKKFKKVYVNIIDFKNYYRQILNKIKEIQAIPIIINISKTNQLIIDKSYFISENIVNYNNVLLKLARRYQCKLVDIYSIIENQPDHQLSDGIHLSKSGNKELANILITEINTIINKKIKN